MVIKELTKCKVSKTGPWEGAAEIVKKSLDRGNRECVK